jgi:hypothetical protein
LSPLTVVLLLIWTPSLVLASDSPSGSLTATEQLGRTLRDPVALALSKIRIYMTIEKVETILNERADSSDTFPTGFFVDL